MQGERDAGEYTDNAVVNALVQIGVAALITEDTKDGKRKHPQLAITSEKKNLLCKENEGSRRDHSIIPRVLPVAPVPRGAGT